ncbi:TetR/AcrR family transcriptional regulator C-terminal domain-containing protein [Actinoplanes sp. NPDC051633]|uniref:TetR/AcrR family transcriptional regulator n=1 Tax=Actinoplanes sp. NPDC051633 TaxID=3155670 RepID=UPI0034418A23
MSDRILPLLFRGTVPSTAKRTGRPAKLTVDAVVHRAIAHADADGLDAVTMARLAADLGVGTMTLYSYVPSRDDLIDLMVDEVSARRALPAPGEPRPESWRDQVLLYAERTRAMYAEHLWLAEVSQIRPPPGPGMLAEREYVLSTVAGLGLRPAQVNTAAVTIQMFVVSAARAEAESELLRRSSGQTTDEWWQDRSQLWEDFFDVERHPTMNDLWLAGGFTDEQPDPYTYGLGLILDGITPG